MQNLEKSIADLLIRGRFWLLLLGVIAAAAAWPSSSQLDFDRSIENMVERDESLLGRTARRVFSFLGIEGGESESQDLVAPYKKLKRTFGGNEVVMAVYRDQQLMAQSGEGIRRLRTLSHALAEVEGVDGVLSLAELDDSLKRLDQSLTQEIDRMELPLAARIAVKRLLGGRVSASSIVQQDSKLAERFRQMFAGYTHGRDQQTAAVVCMLRPESKSQISRRDTVAAIRSAIEKKEKQGFPETMIAGEPVMVVDGFQFVEEDGRRLGWSSTILLALTIILCFRSIRWVVIPIAVVQLTLLLTRASLVWGNLRMSMVSSMLTAIVTVIGVATVVHIIVRYREARTGGLEKREALNQAITLLAIPVFWACATDAVGFLSLLVTNVGPVRDFGVMMAIGSLIVLLSVGLLLTGLALLRLPAPLTRFDTDPKRAWNEDLLDKQLRLPLRLLGRRPFTVAVIVVVTGIAAAAGVFRTEVESDFTKNFRSDSPLVKSYQFVEENLGGAGVWDIVLPAPDKLDWPYLREVGRLQNTLREQLSIEPAADDRSGLTKVMSIADAVVASAPFDLDILLLPKLARDAIVSRIVREMNAAMPVFMRALYGNDPQHENRFYFRIMLRAPERQSSAEKQLLINRVRELVDRELESDAWKKLLATTPKAADGNPERADVTGFFVMLTFLVDSMLADQWKAFGVAAFFIFLMMLCAFRNPLQALVALVPNAMPIVMVLGLMGWLGIKINMGAAMIAAVSMGLSIDSAVHYITSFRRARLRGLSVEDSLQEVQQRVGRALFFSTLALIVGFMVLCFSQFVPTIYFGVLVSLAMVGGLFGNLLVLPLLLTIISRDVRAAEPNDAGESAS